MQSPTQSIVAQKECDRLVEVTREGDSIQVHQLVWGNGVGWYRVASLALDAEAAADLGRALLRRATEASAEASPAAPGTRASVLPLTEARSRTKKRPRSIGAGRFSPADIAVG